VDPEPVQLAVVAVEAAEAHESAVALPVQPDSVVVLLDIPTGLRSSICASSLCRPTPTEFVREPGQLAVVAVGFAAES
jgi:hypothetical protein